MDPAIDYKAIVEELRMRLLSEGGDLWTGDEKIKDKIRCRLAVLLDTDPDTPMQVIVDKLDEKWRRDGLIGEHQERC